MVLGEVIYKQDLYIDFIQDNPDFQPKAKRTISRTEFYNWLISYGIFISGVKPIEGRSSTGMWIKFVGKDESEDSLLF